MRTWIAAHSISTCGFCGCRINAGDPVQVIELPGITRKALRCPDHARGAVDWEAVNASRHGPVIREIERGGFTRVKQIQAPFDPKMAAAGGDE